MGDEMIKREEQAQMDFLYQEEQEEKSLNKFLTNRDLLKKGAIILDEIQLFSEEEKENDVHFTVDELLGLLFEEIADLRRLSERGENE